MEHLWAPWRNQYVSGLEKTTSDRTKDLFFRIGQEAEHDEKNFVLFRGKNHYAILNAYPYNIGHSMIIPYRQVTDLDEQGEEETTEALRMLRRVKAALTASFKPQGFNVGLNLGEAAGAGIASHLHWHIVPRWRFDANFTTTCADTRVHPGDLLGVWGRMKEALGKDGN